MTKPKPKPKPKPPDNADQSRRFVETAKELGADETGRLFNDALGVVQAPKEKKPPGKPQDKKAK